ncbi:unnamed protein product [Heligmosomoides polygyrus]|uniref:Reverse transcriptase domain-containing protein n=1 Tax=Heligmosomoides polygyrus TaxID=6339 RepID=A0A183GTN0_HELPZ|nr:unnamed protein product [Heligmosomoides polygyrus]
MRITLHAQRVPSQYVKVLRELYSGFATKIPPFYNDVVINVDRRVQQGDTISPKLFSATLKNVTCELAWEDMVVKVDSRNLHRLIPSISQAKQMLAGFGRVCGNPELQLNLTKTMFMDKLLMPHFLLYGYTSARETCIWNTRRYMYLGREVNMANDLAPVLGRR